MSNKTQEENNHYKMLDDTEPITKCNLKKKDAKKRFW